MGELGKFLFFSLSTVDGFWPRRTEPSPGFGRQRAGRVKNPQSGTASEGWNVAWASCPRLAVTGVHGNVRGLAQAKEMNLPGAGRMPTLRTLNPMQELFRAYAIEAGFSGRCTGPGGIGDQVGNRPPVRIHQLWREFEHIAGGGPPGGAGARLPFND